LESYDSNLFYQLANQPFKFNTLVRKLCEPYPFKHDRLNHILEELNRLYKEKLGFGLTKALTNQVLWSIQSVLKLRKKGQKASLPKPRKLNQIHKISFTVDYECLKQMDNRLLIKLGQSKTGSRINYKLKLPAFIDSVKTVTVVWIKNVVIQFHIAYKLKMDMSPISDLSGFASIDLGYSNLISMISDRLESLVINGKPLKHYLVWLVDRLSDFQSKEDWISYRKLWLYHHNLMKVFYTTLAKQIANKLIQKKVKHVFIGKNILSIFQQKSNTSRFFNKAFRFMKFGYFIALLKQYLEPYGIEVKLVDESYTSQLDPFTNEKVTRNKSLVKGSKATYHSDLMAALNIAKKAMNTAFHATKEWIRKLTRPTVVKSYCKVSDMYHFTLLLQSALSRL
jgi:IS605 OrfB family transposase